MNNIIRGCNHYKYKRLLRLLLLLFLTSPWLAMAGGWSDGRYNIIKNNNVLLCEREYIVDIRGAATRDLFSCNQLNLGDTVVVTITGNSVTSSFNGDEQVSMGYSVSIPDGVALTANEIFCADAAKAKGTDVGTYSMGLTAASFGTSNTHYNVAFVVTDGSLTITPASVTVVADVKTKVYGTDDAELTATVIGLFHDDQVSFSLSRESGENVGSYTITPAGAALQGNYAVSYLPGVYTVTEAPLTITVMDSKVYDGSALVTAFDAPTLSATGLVAGDYLTAGEVSSNSPAVATYEYPSGIVITEAFATHNGISNYEVSYDLTQQITRSNAMAFVNCETLSQTRAYNGLVLSAQPVVNVTEATVLEYRVNGADWSVIAVPDLTDVGTLNVNVRASNPNYDTTYCQYNLTVEPAELTVTAHPQSKIYGSADPELTATITGLQNGDDESLITYTLSRESGENVGSYTITPSGETIQGNYRVLYNPSDFIITAAQATVTAHPKSKTYGQADPELTATITGLQNSDEESVITYSLTRESGENVGEYTITPSGDTLQGNYRVLYDPSNLIITPAQATVTAHPKSKIYGSADPELTVTITGLQNDDDESVITYSLARETGENVGEYIITPSGDTLQGNYRILYAPSNFIITSAQVTVIAHPKSKIYGQTDPELTATITGLQNGDDESVITYNLTRESGENVGEYTITPSGDTLQGNYRVLYDPSNLIITAAQATVTAHPKSKIYGSTDPELTASITGLQNGDDESVITYNLTRESGENVGEYVITPSGDTLQGNYRVLYDPSDFTITAAQATVTAHPKSKIYGSADPELTVTITGLQNDDDESVITYSLTRESGENVGEYTITPSGDTLQGNYHVLYDPSILIITPATATVSANPKSKIYGQADPELTATITGLQNNDDESGITYSLTREPGENVGEYTITPSGDTLQGNYRVLYDSSSLIITPASLTITVFDTKMYDGSVLVTAYDAAGVTATGLANGDYLTAGVVSSNGVEVATYVYPDAVVITEAFATHNGISNYEVSYDLTQQITRNEMVFVNCGELTQTRVYNGFPLSAQAILSVTQGTLVEYSVDGADWSSVSVPEITNVGTINVNVRASNPNYDTTYCQYSLTVLPAEVTVTAQPRSKIYGSADPTLTATITGLQNNEDESLITYSLSRESGENVGIYTITPSGETLQGNYTVLYVPSSFTITSATAIVTAHPKSKIYGQTDPELTATITGLQYNDNESVITYSLSRESGENVGSYIVTPSGDTLQGNYRVLYDPSNLIITSAPATVSAHPKSKIYGQADPELTATITGLQNGDDESVIIYSLSRESGENVGTYTITPSGEAIQGNYTVLYNLSSLVITPATATVSAEAKTKVYGSADPTLTATVTGLQNGDAVSVINYILSRESGENVGEYVITPTGDTLQNNYNVLYDLSNLVITPASLTITIYDTKVYDGNVMLTSYNTPNAVSATGLVEGDYLIAGQVTSNGSDVSTYIYPATSTITEAFNTYKGISNYVVDYNITQRISRDNALAVSNCTALTKSRLYNGSALSSTVEVNIAEGTTVEYSVEGSDWSASTVPSITNVGSINVRVRVTNPNYDTVYCNYSLTVYPVELTVTANDQIREYGESNPALEGVIAGFVNGEDATVITGVASYSTEALTSSQVGTYPIVPDVSALSAENYTFRAVNGTLTVTRATATVKADAKTKVYGEEDPALTVSISGLRNDDAESVITYMLSRATGENVGNHIITPVGNAIQGNYNVLYVSSSLIITPATATVTAYPKSKIYGSVDPELTASITGLQNNDDESVITYSLSRESGENVGTYTITPSGDTLQGNYSVLYVSSSLNITTAQVTVTAHPKSKIYGFADPELTASITGLQNNDDESVITYSLSRESGENVGSYTITPSGETLQGNYTVLYAPSSLTITPASLTITLFDAKMFDGSVLVTAYNTVGAVTTNGLAEGDYLTAGEVRSNGSEVALYEYPVGVTITEAFATHNGIENYLLTYVITQKISRNDALEIANCATLTQSRAYNGTTLSPLPLVNIAEGTVVEYSVGDAEWATEPVPSITNVGSLNVRVRATNPNYETVSCNYSLTIEPAVLTVTADAKTKVYGQADPELTAIVSGLQNGESANLISYALNRSEGENVGTYAITPSGEVTQGNYTVQYVPSDLSITPATATVTAHPKSKIYGQADPELTATITGLQNGDSEEVITYTLSRIAGENIGTYAIIPSGETVQGNYNVLYVSSSLSITPATVTVTAEPKTKVYGQADPELTAILTGLQNSDEESIIAYTLSRAPGENIGTYNITPTGNAIQGNYTVQYDPSSLVITRATATVTAHPKSKIYGQSDPELTATVTGLQNGDNEEVITYTLSRIAGENIGNYTITPSGEAIQGNYNVLYDLSSLIITPAQATVTAHPKSKIYGQADPELTAIVTGLQNGDDESVIVYTLSREVGENIGTYAVTPTGETSQGNYSVQYVPSNLIITSAQVTVTANPKSKVYGATDPELTASITGLQNGDEESAIVYTLSREAGESVGVYAITPDGEAVQGNYNVNYVPATLRINKAAVTVTAEDKTKIYGEEDPALTVVISGLQNGDDESVITYTLNRVAGENVGYYSINVSGAAVQGNYDVSFVSAVFSITRATMTVTAESKTKVYGDSDPELTATVTGMQNGDAASVITYTLSRVAGENIGEYTITPSGYAIQGNYNVLYVPSNFVITRATATVTAHPKSKIYGQADPELTATVTGLQNGDNEEVITYTLSRISGENIGTYTITPSGESVQGNYDVQYEPSSLVITRATAIVTSNPKTKIYGQADPELTATVTGLQNGDNEEVITYTLSRIAGENIGTYTITPSGESVQGNYNVLYEPSNLVIARAQATVTAHPKSKIYGQADPELTATVTGLQNGDNEEMITYTLSRIAGENIGSYTITPSGESVQGNYNVLYVPSNLVITCATATVTANPKSKIYGQADPELTATVTGLQNGDNEEVITYNLSRVSGENIGSYTITPSGNATQGNYNVLYVQSNLTITPALATVTADAKTKVYGDADPSFTATVTGLQNGDNEEVITYTFSRASGENVGSYTITPAGNAIQGNYNVVFVQSALTITPATAIVTANPKSKIYGQIDPELTATITGLQNGDNEEVITYTLSRVSGENVGTYKISPSGAVSQGNYNVLFAQSDLTITPATATVTAASKTKVYGDADPELTATVTGMCNGESTSLISYTLGRAAGENVGSYTITPSGATLQGNYSVQYVTSTMSITRATVMVTADDKTKGVGEADPVLTATVTGLKNNDAPSVLIYQLSRAAGEDIGDYTITVTGAAVQGNYNVNYVSGTLTITRLSVTVTAVNKSKTYADADPELTATISGLNSGADPSVITYSLSRAAGENVGEYAIIPTGDTLQGNYRVNFVSGVFTINRAVVTVTAHNKTKDYGDPDPDFTSSVTGMRNDEPESLITYTVTRAVGENVGNYAITPTGDVEQGNYRINYVSARLSISRVRVTVTPDDIIKIYGDPDPEFTVTVTGLKNGDDASVINYSMNRAVGENVGIYLLTPVVSPIQGNYTVGYSYGTLNIRPAPVTVTADNKTKVYGDADPAWTATVSGLKNDEAPSVISYSLNRVAGENVGSYVIRATGTGSQGNYSVTFVQGALTITPYPVMVAITGNTSSRTYNAEEQSVSGYTLVIPEGLALTQENIVCSNAAIARGTNAGTYYMGLTATDFSNTNGNYGVTYNIVDGQLTINRAGVRVKANNVTKALGEADPVFTATVIGLKGSDDPSVLSYTFTREPGETVGTYFIYPQGDTIQGNYNVVRYQPGQLTIIFEWPSCPTIGTTTYTPAIITDRTDELAISTPITDVASIVEVTDAYYSVTVGDDDFVLPASYSSGSVNGVLTLQNAWRGKAITVALTIVFSGCENTSPMSGDPLKICVPFANAPSISYTGNTDGLGKQELFQNHGGYVVLKAAVDNRDTNKVAEYGFLVSTDPSDIAAYNSVFAKSASFMANDTMIYNISLDSCTKHLYYKPYLILNDCDSTKVYGQQKDFTMWHPDLQALTVSPSSTVSSGTEITLTAVATMNVGSWPNFYNRYSDALNDAPPAGCGLNTDASATKPMEEWMQILLNCPRAANAVRDFMGMDVHDADFSYTWEPIGYSSPQPWSPGITTTTPTQTTTYRGSAIFTYRGMVCKVSDTITVTVQ